MVTDNHYRWDFIGLSTDEKPTPATSEKVVDGSTFYCSDTSKLYVFCKDTWYERKALGGGGGTSYTAGTGIDITDDTISIDDDVVATLSELNARIAKGEGAPTTATEGVVGGLYEDNTNGKLYICTAITAGVDPDPDTYTWSEVGGGGGGPTVVQTTGTSQTDVMSQNATTSMVFDDPGTRYQVKIGAGSSVGTSRNVAIGQNTTASNTNSVAVGSYSWTNAPFTTAIGDGSIAGESGSSALGYHATTNTNTYSVALGARASTSRNGEVNVGAAESFGYNNTKYRVIGGVHDGQDAHDAATVSQVNSVIDAINTALSTNISHIGA